MSANARRLRDHVNRFAEVVVNVSDLERSIAFYEQATPLRVHRRTIARDQPFRALGLPRGGFHGALLADATSIEPGVSVHLVQWRSPAPIGSAYPVFFHAGYQRICFEVADPAEYHRTLASLGIETFGPPRDRGPVLTDGPSVVSFSFPDPDGVALHITRRPPNTRSDVPDQLYHVSPVVSDTDAACAFFEGVLGLDCRMRVAIDQPRPAGYGRGAELGQFDAAILGHRGDHRFHVDIVNWVVPGVQGVPYQDPTHVGIQRLVFEVDDVDAAHAALLDELPEAVRPTVRGPETWDLGDVGPRRVLFFQSPEGLPLELVEAATRTLT